jgi:hypothetical protein
VKRFYSIRLKHYQGFIPTAVAQQMLKEESPMIRYLDDNRALEFRFIKSRNRLDLYADEKYLMLAKMKYKDVFENRARMGFMELYISRLIKKRISLAKGSS